MLTPWKLWAILQRLFFQNPKSNADISGSANVEGGGWTLLDEAGFAFVELDALLNSGPNPN